MEVIHRLSDKLQDFHNISRSVDSLYLEKNTKYNSYVISMAAVISLIIESFMIIRVFINQPTLSTVASRIYLSLYVSLWVFSALYLAIQAVSKNKVSRQYWVQFGFVAFYLLWNVLLNSYDLYKVGSGSSLSIVTAIIFASILINFRPQHTMLLQVSTYIIFVTINYGRIDDTINAGIAIAVSVIANILFYVQDIRSVYNEQRVAEVNAQLEKEQMDGAIQYLQRLQDAQTQTAIYNHDLRHTLNLVSQFVLQGNFDKLHDFLSKSQENLDSLSSTFFCEHVTANLIFGSFAQRSSEKGINFITEISLEKQLQISDTDLCALLSNLLENALIASSEVLDQKYRRIYTKAVTRDNKLIIMVENGFVGTVDMKNGLPVSQSEDKLHGYGVQSIKTIAERYKGLYNFETDGNIFRAKILLHF